MAGAGLGILRGDGIRDILRKREPLRAVTKPISHAKSTMNEHIPSTQCVDAEIARKRLERSESLASEGVRTFLNAPSEWMVSETERMVRSLREIANNPDIPDDASVAPFMNAGTVRQLIRSDRPTLLSELRLSSGYSQMMNALSSGEIREEKFDFSSMLAVGPKDAVVLGLLMLSEKKPTGTLSILNEAFGTDVTKDSPITIRGKSMTVAEFFEKALGNMRTDFERQLRNIRESCEKAEILPEPDGAETFR